MLDVMQDARYAGRLIRRSPAYSLTVVCVLAIGIAANVIAFSLFKSLTITPLAGVRDSGRLLFIGARSDGGQILPQSFPDYEYARDHGFPGLAAWAIQPLILGSEGEGRQVMGELVTGNYFSVLEVGAAAGRTLTPADVVRNGAPVVVISHGLWQRAFGGDTAIVGRTIRLNAQPVTVAGVSSARFRGAIVGLSTDVFVPITMQPQLVGSNSIDTRNNRWVHPFMRPPARVPRETLEAEVASLARAISETAPGRDLELALVPFLRWPYGAQSIMLPAASLIGVTALLLLAVVSANVAGLVLVRSLARRGETAARLTLGASRVRILRQLLLESLVLAIPGALVGFLIPQFAETYVGAAAERVPFPLYFNVEPDRFVVGFIVLLTVTSAVAYSLLPALRLSRVDVATVLKDDGARGAARSRLRTVLVVAQVAIALTLLVGTALVVRTLDAAQDADAGFDARSVTWATFDARAGGLDEAGGRNLYERLLKAVRAESGVRAASLATFLPLNFIDMMGWDAAPEGYQRRPGEDTGGAVNVVGTDYFRTMGIPLVAGREFTDDDAAATTRPLIVNETFAKKYWGSAGAAVGRRVVTGGNTASVVGVARDIKYARLDEPPRPYIYAFFAHTYVTSMTLHVRADAEAPDVVDRVRALARELDPSMTVLTSGTLSGQLAASTSLYETVARVLVVIGAMAAALAALGIYGLVAYTVKQRAHEIGIRMAIGATSGIVLRYFLARGLALTAIGVVVGGVASVALSRLMSRMLFGVATTDLVSFASALALVVTAAAIASFVPAWRGSRVDPVEALRHH